MKRIVSIILALIGCVLLCSCGASNTPETESVNENLQKFGGEFADSNDPAKEIAWSLATVLSQELQENNIELNPSEFDVGKYVKDTEISEFGEELEVYAIVCRPYLETSGEFRGGAWIRVAWSSMTCELRNIYIESNVAGLDNEALVESIFQSSTLQEMYGVYSELRSADTAEISNYRIHMIDNVISFEFPENGNSVARNIEILPHSVYVKNGELFYSNGERVLIDAGWVFNPVE